MRVIFYVFLLVLLVLALSFSAINSHDVALNYYVGSVTLPLSILLVLSIAFGAFFGILAMIKPLMVLRLEVARLKRAKQISEQEVSNLRSMPIKEPGS